MVSTYSAPLCESHPPSTPVGNGVCLDGPDQLGPPPLQEALLQPVGDPPPEPSDA